MMKPFCNLYYEGEAKNSGFPRLLPHMCTGILPNTLQNGFSFTKEFILLATATTEALPKEP
jgi:hypothetical protein